MKKSLLRISFVLIALVLSSKAFIALFGYQAIESARDAYGEQVSISYGWISSSFDGSLIVKDLVLTPYALKRPFRIPELRLAYGSYLALISGLLELKSLSLHGLERISMLSLSAPLEGRDPEEWLAAEYAPEIMLPFGVYACGDTSRIGHEELTKLGVSEQRADITIDLAGSQDGVPTSVQLQADLYELGRISLEFSLPSGLNELGPLHSELQNVTFRYADNGYLRRIANFCEQATGLTRNEFSQRAALEWQNSLTSNGVVINDALVNTYYTFMRLGGQLSVSLFAEKVASASTVFTQFDKNLIDEYKVSLLLNDASVAAASLTLKSAHFRPELVEKVEPLPEKAAPEKRFIPLELGDLDKSLGKELRVVLSSGKRHEGTLQTSDEFYFVLVPPVGGGNVTYSVQREEVAELFVLSAEP